MIFSSFVGVFVVCHFNYTIKAEKKSVVIIPGKPLAVCFSGVLQTAN